MPDDAWPAGMEKQAPVLWQWYMQLTRVEEAFKTLKSDLSLTSFAKQHGRKKTTVWDAIARVQRGDPQRDRRREKPRWVGRGAARIAHLVGGPCAARGRRYLLVGGCPRHGPHRRA